MTGDPQDTEASRQGWSERWSPLGGLAFVIGIIALFILAPDTEKSPEEVIAAADGQQDRYVALAIFGLASLPLVLWFVAGLHARVRRLQSQTAPGLVLAGGTAFALLFFMATGIWAVPIIGFPGEADPTIAANTYITIDDLGYFALGGGGVAFAVMAVAASIAALRSRAIPAWLGWLGAIVGLLSAATVAVVGAFAWMAWILVASLLLLVRRA
jgi:hypothetical protein